MSFNHKFNHFVGLIERHPFVRLLVIVSACLGILATFIGIISPFSVRSNAGTTTAPFDGVEITVVSTTPQADGRIQGIVSDLKSKFGDMVWQDIRHDLVINANEVRYFFNGSRDMAIFVADEVNLPHSSLARVPNELRGSAHENYFEIWLK